MTKSQTDVDRVMAAFGAAPIRYRASQERAVTGAESASRAFETAVLRPVQPDPHLVSETPAPGAGGQIRQIFPLLSRAVPAVGDVSVDAVKRPGDELPLPPEPETVLSPFDQALAEQAHLRGQSAPSAPTASEEAAAQVHVWAASLPKVSAAPTAPAEASQPPVPQPVMPLPALRSHADLIQPLPSQPAAPQFVAPQLVVPQQPAPPQPSAAATPPYAAPQPAAPQPAAPQTWHPQPMPLPPAYYPPPQPPYPYPPQPAPYPHAGYAPGYPPGYPPQAYPYPYPPQPTPYPPMGYAPGYPPQAYPYPPQPAPVGQPPAPPGYAAPPEPAAAEPTNLADIFAALQRARGGYGPSGNR